MTANPLRRLDAASPVDASAFHAALGRAAIVSLYDELALEPKPGLVSFADAGSHADMNAGTFLRSLFALRHFFVRVAASAGGNSSKDITSRGSTASARRRRR